MLAKIPGLDRVLRPGVLRPANWTTDKWTISEYSP
jgi:hypothetical protein